MPVLGTPDPEDERSCYVAAVSSLVDVFAAAWSGDAPPSELAERLERICAGARAAHPGLAFDDRELVAAIAARCPRDGALAYVENSRGPELALARCAARGDGIAIATF